MRIELLIVAAMLFSALAGLSGATLDAASAEFMASIGRAEFQANNSSHDSIAFAGRDELISSPHNLTPGGGYYSTNPILMGPGTGSQTRSTMPTPPHPSATRSELPERYPGRQNIWCSHPAAEALLESTGFTTTQMSINEVVTDGKVNIGVLVGEGGKGRAGASSLDPRNSAWRDPDILIDEDYIGTFNISKNLAFNSSYSLIREREGWLKCCGKDGIISPPPELISAEDVFDCHR